MEQKSEYIRDQYRCIFILKDDVLKITVSDENLCEEYINTINDFTDAKMFAGHPIIRNVQKIYQVLAAYFEQKPCVQMTYEKKTETTGDKFEKYFEFNINVHTEFDDDTDFTIKLLYIEQPLTMEKIVAKLNRFKIDLEQQQRDNMEHITEMMQQYQNEVSHTLMSIRSELDTMVRKYDEMVQWQKSVVQNMNNCL